MVKTIIIPFALIAISASFVIAKVPEVFSREASDNDLLARDNSDTILEERNVPETTMFSREDTAALQEREPFAFLAPLLARVGGRIASRVASRAARNHVNNRNNNRRKRDLEDEDDFAAREDGLDDEFMERDLDMVEREMGEEDILDREVDEDLYLD